MTGRALVIQHDHVSPPGFVGERLEQRGFELVLFPVVPAERFHDPGVTVDYPDPASFDLIVSMGAPWSTYDPQVASWVRPELELLRRADTAGVPVLGICFGGQLLATAHGGTVSPSPHPEIGWRQVSGDDRIVPSGEWFEWHYDRWTVPPRARELARNAAASQAFVLRRNLAVQFHPELGVPMLSAWLDQGGHRKAVEFGLDPDQLLAQTREREAAARLRAHRLVDAFLAVATGGGGGLDDGHA